MESWVIRAKRTPAATSHLYADGFYVLQAPEYEGLEAAYGVAVERNNAQARPPSEHLGAQTRYSVTGKAEILHWGR